jgi:LysM repeat protein
MDDSAKNARPAANTSLPLLTLLVLVGLIAALLYIGYDSLADDTGNAKALTDVTLDTTDQAMAGQTDNPDDLLPDTTGGPTPIDLSQAPADSSAVEDDQRGTLVTDNKPSEADKPAPTAKPNIPKPEPAADSPERPNGPTSTYTVGEGETFYGVANRLNMKVSTLKALNPGVSENEVKSGVTKLNVRVKAVHTVGAGDVLRVVAAKYGVSKEAIMKANRKTKDYAARGEKLIIPLTEKE